MLYADKAMLYDCKAMLYAGKAMLYAGKAMLYKNVLGMGINEKMPGERKSLGICGYLSGTAANQLLVRMMLTTETTSPTSILPSPLTSATCLLKFSEGFSRI